MAQPRQQLQNPPDEPQVPPPQTSWLDRAERGAAVAQAWVTLAEKVVGLLFKVLILVAVSCCVWGGLSVMAEGKATWQTEEGARSAGRTLNAFLSAFSAPALVSLGAVSLALLLTVVLTLRGGGGFSGDSGGAAAPTAQPPPPSPPQQAHWGQTGAAGWYPPWGAGPGDWGQRQEPPPPQPALNGAPPEGLEAGSERGAPAPPRRRGLGR